MSHIYIYMWHIYILNWLTRPTAAPSSTSAFTPLWLTSPRHCPPLDGHAAAWYEMGPGHVLPAPDRRWINWGCFTIYIYIYIHIIYIWYDIYIYNIFIFIFTCVHNHPQVDRIHILFEDISCLSHFSDDSLKEWTHILSNPGWL